MPKNPPVFRANDQLEHALLSAWSTQADAGICVIDDTLRVIMLNPAACRMLGVDGLATLNQPFVDLVASVNFESGTDHWLATPGFLGEHHAKRESKAGNTDLLFKATSVRLANSASNGEGDDGGAIFTVFAITDITQLVAAQRQVNSESYRRQWQALNAGVVISDARLPDMPIVYVNPMFEQMSSQILSFSKQFAESVVKANTVAVDHFEKIIDVQLKGFEDRMTTMAELVENAAVVKSPEEFRAFMPKSISMIKTVAEKNVALGQEIAGITTRSTETMVNLVKGQFDVANDSIVKASKVAIKK